MLQTDINSMKLEYLANPAIKQLFNRFIDRLGKSSFPYPIYFLGDLDWSGLSIFRSIKTVFPELRPWKKGYKIMINARENGQCHSPKMAGKEGQKKIETTNDEWLDQNVVKLFNNAALFVDQEVIG